MKCLRRPDALLCLAILTAAALATIPARAETLVGSNVDSRVILAFKIGDEAAQGALPEGWAAAPFGGGALAGANFLAVFMDRHLNLDAEGEVHRDGLFRGVAFAVPAKAEGSDETVYFVTRVYLPDDGINPYKNTLRATVSREATLSGSGVAPGTGRESWTVEDGAGGKIVLSMAYRGAVPSLSEREAKIYSNVEPDFYRIYRYEQLVDLVRSGPAEIDRVDDYAFSVSIEELAPIFDGSEELVGILRLPWYSRRTFLP